jgi:serine/threonine protein kinase
MELLEAASQGDLELLQRLLDIHDRIPTLDEDDIINFSREGWTCLHFACLSGHSQVAMFLVSQEATCNGVTTEGWTPLQLAAFHGKTKAVEALLSHPSIQIHKATQSKPTALHLSVSAGHPDIVRLLLEAGASMILEDAEGKTPIETTDNMEILEMLALYMGREFIEKYRVVPESYGAQLFYRNNFLLNDKYVYLYLCLQSGVLLRYNSEIDFRQGKLPKRRMRLSEILEVKTESRGFFDKTNNFLFSVRNRAMKRTYYTTNEAATLDWVTRIKQAIEYVQTSGAQLSGLSQLPGRSDSTTSTVISGGNGSEIVEDDLIMQESTLTQEVVCLSSFSIVKVLGEGSFGKVYKAVKKNTGEVLAIKSLSKRNLEKKRQLKYAVNEARVMKQLDHPNIVALKFCFQTKRCLYLALEYCPNGDLGMHLKQWRKFDEDRARFYIAQTMLALEYLHNRDIVYRDLKPENLLLDSVGNIKLTDFGLVKDQLTSAEGVAASFCGSPAYLAPEMIRGQISSKAGDIYTLGVVLYEMLTGETPFYTKDMQVLFNRVLKEKLTFPSYVSKQAKEFITKAMMKDPSKRGCIQTMLNHPYMRAVDFEALERGRLETPRLGPGWVQYALDECHLESIAPEDVLTVDIDEVDERSLIKEFMPVGS